MTRKHFVQTAIAIRLIEDEDERMNRFAAMADTFAAANPRFDRVRFALACGI